MLLAALLHLLAALLALGALLLELLPRLGPLLVELALRLRRERREVDGLAARLAERRHVRAVRRGGVDPERQLRLEAGLGERDHLVLQVDRAALEAVELLPLEQEVGLARLAVHEPDRLRPAVAREERHLHLLEAGRDDVGGHLRLDGLVRLPGGAAGGLELLRRRPLRGRRPERLPLEDHPVAVARHLRRRNRRARARGAERPGRERKRRGAGKRDAKGLGEQCGTHSSTSLRACATGASRARFFLALTRPSAFARLPPAFRATREGTAGENPSRPPGPDWR